jgi:hypothetical protein
MQNIQKSIMGQQTLLDQGPIGIGLLGSYLINSLVKQQKVLVNVLDVMLLLIFEFSQLRLLRIQYLDI